MSKKIETVDDLKKEAFEALQTCLNVKGTSYTDFTANRLDTRPRSHQLEKHLHLTGFRTVRELYEKWFGDVIGFNGNMMIVKSVEKLAAGNENLMNIFSLQARTEEKGKKKSRKGGRGVRPVPQPQPVYPSRRQATTTHSEAQLPEVRDFPSPYYSHSPSPALPHSNSMPPNVFPEFDNQSQFVDDRFNVPINDYYPENENFHPSVYSDYGSRSDLYTDDNDYQYLSGPPGFSQQPLQKPQYDYEFSEDESASAMDYNFYAKRDLSEAELALQRFINDHQLQQDQKMNLEFSRKPYVAILENWAPKLADEVWDAADKIGLEDPGKYCERRSTFPAENVIDYFVAVISELLETVVIEEDAIPFHKALTWLQFSLLSKPGFGYFDVFKLVQKLKEIFMVFETSDEPPVVIMIAGREQVTPDVIRAKIQTLIPNLKNGFEAGHGKVKVFESTDPDYPYYIVENTEKIARKLHNYSQQLVPVEEVYPRLLCLIIIDGSKYRAQVISCQNFSGGDDVLVELIDVGKRLRRSVKDLRALTVTELIEAPRCSLPAVLRHDSTSLNLSVDDNDFFKRRSTVRLVSVDIVLKNNLIDYASIKLI